MRPIANYCLFLFVTLLTAAPAMSAEHASCDNLRSSGDPLWIPITVFSDQYGAYVGKPSGITSSPYVYLEDNGIGGLQKVDGTCWEDGLLIHYSADTQLAVDPLWVV